MGKGGLHKKKFKDSSQRLRYGMDARSVFESYAGDTGDLFPGLINGHLAYRSGREVVANILSNKRYHRATDINLVNNTRAARQSQSAPYAHSAQAGRSSTKVALRANAQISRRGLLSPTDAVNAVHYNLSHYDPKSIMIIQNIINTNVNGQFSLNDAQAVAGYQQNKTGVDGMVGENTLNVMVPELARQNSYAEAITLVTDYYNLNLQETLSIHYDARVAGSSGSFESGYLHVIRVGPQVFRKATVLLQAIASEMAAIAPGHMPIHVPQRLNLTQVQTAIVANRARLRELSSILILQDLVQTPISGVIDAQSCQHIAEYQYSRGLISQPDGRINRHTLQSMVSELIGRRHYNSVIRLIIDYYNLSTHGALLDIAAGPATTIDGWIPGPTNIRIGQVWFQRSFAALVHQISHMLDRVRTRKAGITSIALRTFLGEAVEIMSVGTPEETLHGFMLDARRAWVNWNRISKQERRRYWPRFHQVRAKVYQRYAAARPAQQRAFARLMRLYFSASRP